MLAMYFENVVCSTNKKQLLLLLLVPSRNGSPFQKAWETHESFTVLLSASEGDMRGVWSTSGVWPDTARLYAELLSWCCGPSHHEPHLKALITFHMQACSLLDCAVVFN